MNSDINFDLHLTFSSLLEAAQHDNGDIYLPSAYFVAGKRVYAGISANRPHLYFPVDDPRKLVLNLGDYLVLQNSISEFGAASTDGSPYLEIVAREGFDVPLFASLCQFIVTRLGSDDVDEVISTVEIAVQNFYQMLKTANGPEFDEPRLIGLWGEIWFVNFALSQRANNVSTNWRGPLRGRHDFVFSAASVEVKTSTIIATRTVEIHGLSQLEALPGKSLYLALIQIDWDPAGNSLEDLIAAARGSLRGSERVVFDDKLSEMKVDDEYLESIGDAKFSISHVGAYEVDTSFPRIDNSILEKYFGGTVPISNVRYRLSLDGRGQTELAKIVFER